MYGALLLDTKLGGPGYGALLLDPALKNMALGFSRRRVQLGVEGYSHILVSDFMTANNYMGNI